MKDSLKASLLATLLVAAAFVLRVYRLDFQSLWFDEIASLYQSIYLFSPEDAPGHLVQQTYFSQSYSLMMRPWVFLVSDAFGLRWPSVLAGTLSVALAYRVSRQLHSRRAGLLAAAFFAVGPVQIYYSQEVRQYSIVLLLAMLSLWALTLVEGHTRWPRVLYPICVALLVTFQIVTILWVAVQSGWLALRSKGGTGGGRSVWLVTLAGLLPILLFLVVQLPGKGPAWISRPAPGDMPGLLWTALAGVKLPATGGGPSLWVVPAQLVLVALIFEGLLAALHWSARPPHAADRRWGIALLAGLVLLPMAAAYALSYLWVPMWVPRYLLPSMGTALLLIAVAAASLRPRWLGGILVAVILLLQLRGSLHYYFDRMAQRDNWRDVAAHLANHQVSSDLVLVPFAHQIHALNFYLRDEPIFVATMDVTQLTDALGDNRRVWVLSKAMPRTAVPRVLEAAPSATLREFADFGTLKLYLYQNAPPPTERPVKTLVVG